MDLSGRTALVTGAGGGIGLAVAERLLAEGAGVAASDVKPCPPVLAAAAERCLFLQGDITEREFVETMVAEAVRRFGGLNYVVNVAGVAFFDGGDGSAATIDLGVWGRTLDVNLTGALHVVRASLPHLKAAQPAAMVHVASVVGLRSMDNVLEAGPLDAYQVSKAALVSLSRGLAVQLGADGIRSNTVCPGSVWTPMTSSIYADPRRVEAMARRTPLKRVGRPEDIAAACAFLLSDDAAFITGIDLVVDGGLMAKLC